MGMTILFLCVIAFLYKFSKIDKWWLWFTTIIGILAQLGYELRMFGFIAAIAAFKVFKDIFS